MNIIQTRQFFTLFLLTLASAASASAQGIISSIAGNGITQYIGDGWPGTSYSLAGPGGICADKSGDIFEVDFAAPRVRRVNKQDTLFTYAGTGITGYTGDGGPAAIATFNEPIGISIDTSGNLYILEQYNNTVRKINRISGTISTVCGNGGGGFSGDGGPATDAHMEQPAGLYVDIAGNIYIADKGNNRIRKVEAATGNISTIAGTGTLGFTGDGGPATNAQIGSPRGVCADLDGNVFIADYANNRIRKVDAITGFISTIAGTGAASFSGDNGPAISAELAQPNSVYSSRATGILYISDYGNNRIRSVTTDGIIHTVAGSGMYGYAGDGGPAINATFLGPTGVCVDDSENIYIADFGNSVIRKVSHGVNAVSNTISDHSISLFPNPTSGIFTISTDLALHQSEITVINTLGQQVYTARIARQQNTIDISGAPPGMYFVQIQTGDLVLTGKILLR
jgi:trimeric autotransporter adhesin